MDISLTRKREFEKKKAYREALERQMEEKKHGDDKYRLYMDQKDLATNGAIFQGLNPALYRNTNKSKTSMQRDDQALKEEVVRLNQSLNGH